MEVPQGHVALNYQERTLLHLLRFAGMEELYQVDPGVTQGEIAKAVGIQRKHLPRALSKLVKEDLIIERRAHVSGVRQIRRVYFLTWKGQVRATTIRDALRARKVSITQGSESHEVTIQEVQDMVGIRYSLLELYDSITADGAVDLLAMTSQHAGHPADRASRRPSPAATQEEAKNPLDIYRVALDAAWLDGRLTLNEHIILNHLRRTLGVSEEDHQRIEAETLARMPLIQEERLDVYRVALAAALQDYRISTDQQLIIETLRERLRISVEEHEALVEEIVRERSSGVSTSTSVAD